MFLSSEKRREKRRERERRLMAEFLQTAAAKAVEAIDQYEQEQAEASAYLGDWEFHMHRPGEPCDHRCRVGAGGSVVKPVPTPGEVSPSNRDLVERFEAAARDLEERVRGSNDVPHEALTRVCAASDRLVHSMNLAAREPVLEPSSCCASGCHDPAQGILSISKLPACSTHLELEQRGVGFAILMAPPEGSFDADLAEANADAMRAQFVADEAQPILPRAEELEEALDDGPALPQEEIDAVMRAGMSDNPELVGKVVLYETDGRGGKRYSLPAIISCVQRTHVDLPLFRAAEEKAAEYVGRREDKLTALLEANEGLGLEITEFGYKVGANPLPIPLDGTVHLNVLTPGAQFGYVELSVPYAPATSDVPRSWRFHPDDVPF